MIDTTTNQVTGTLKLSSTPRSITVGSTGTVYVATSGTSGRIVAINPATGAIIQTVALATPLGRIAASPSGTALYALAVGLAGATSGSLKVIDTATGQVSASIPVGRAASDVIVSPDAAKVYVANGDDTVGVIDAVTNTVLQTVAVDPTPGPGAERLAISADGSAVYVTDKPDNQVWVVSTAPAGVSNLGGVTVAGTLSGFPSGTPLVNAGGTRALVVTDRPSTGSTLVATLDPTTGKQIGSTISLSGTTLTDHGSTYPPLLSADGTRAVVTTTVTNPTTAATTTRVSVIDTATGAQVGTTVTITGDQSYSARLLNNDGTRALITTRIYDGPVIDNYTTRVAVINIVTGAQLGTTLTLSGGPSPSSSTFSADGTRAVISTTPRNYNPATDATQVAFLDATTGTQIGTTRSVVGRQQGQLLINADGTRALVATATQVAVLDVATGTTTHTFTGAVQPLDAALSRALITTTTPGPTTGTYTNHVALVDLGTGNQIGTAVSLTSSSAPQTLRSPDGTRALFWVSDYDAATAADITQIAAFNTSTGTPIGNTLALTGTMLSPSLQVWSPDSARAIVTTYTYDSGVYTNRTTVIDTNTGNQIGTTIVPATLPALAPVVSADSSRALVTTSTLNAASGDYLIRAAMLDTSTGSQIGTTVNLGGAFRTAAYSADGTRLLITTATNTAVIDTATGNQIGSTVTAGGTPQMSLDGTHAVVISVTQNTSGTAATSIQTAVVDLATGTQTGGTTTITLDGIPLWASATDANPMRRVITTSAYDSTIGDYVIRAVVIDATTGSQIGNTTRFVGAMAGPPVLSADGSRAMITTVTQNKTTHVAVIQIV